MSEKSCVVKILVALVVLALSGPASRVQADQTFLVTNTGDTGAGSLRWAIEQSNLYAGTDTIAFAIPAAGLQTISPASALPAITDPVIIDGLTQSGASCATWPPVLLIELDGSSAGGGVFGLSVFAGDSTIRGLVINSFSFAGIRLTSGNHNTVSCNYIGTDAAGSVDLGNFHGVYIANSADNVIGGATATARNLISGNGDGDSAPGSGVQIEGSSATHNQVRGNYIGTDSLGTAGLGNAISGVHVQDAPANTIGGAAAGERNIISGNGYYGVYLDGSGSTDNVVQGNYIGVDVTGVNDLGNGSHGVYVYGASDSAIGGTTGLAGNLVSGNDGSGVRIELSTAAGNLVQGNLIGLQANGAARLDNVDSGVYIQGASNNTIGGGDEGAGNVISGNTHSGISIYEGAANTVQGNLIGTQADGATALPNTWSGVFIVNASANVIGGTSEAERNVVSGNSVYGVSMFGASAIHNLVQGNYIGTGIDGTASLGNGQAGVIIWAEASGNQVGGTTVSEGNLIAHNGDDGVYVESGSGNTISHNAILLNAGLGIDLGQDGVNLNDPDDNDDGANHLQNYPVLALVTLGNDSTTVQGTLDSAPSTSFRLDFYYSASADPTEYGEGEVYFGSLPVDINESGDNAAFSVTFDRRIPWGSYVSATATDPNKNTSEFSRVFHAPTAVKLLDLGARAVDRHIVVEWTTASEIDNLGFNLYRAEAADGLRTRLNESLIPSLIPGSPLGASYSWADDDTVAGYRYYYWLEDVDVYGVTTLHGPVSATLGGYRYYLTLVTR